MTCVVADTDAAVMDVERLHEADMEKLAMLNGHIQAVAQARLMQQKSDEQLIYERQQEQARHLAVHLSPFVLCIWGSGVKRGDESEPREV